MRKTARHIARLGGFSLPELMLVVAIISILSSLSLAIGSSILRRERVNAIALGLTGWIENVRGQSMKVVSADPGSGGCAINFFEGQSASPGFLMAALVNDVRDKCSSESEFRIPFGSEGSYDIEVDNESPNDADLVYTPRGAVFMDSQSDPVIIKIFLKDSGPLRCVRIDTGLGLIRIGSSNSAVSVADSCADSDYAKF